MAIDVSASKLKIFSNCPRLYYYNYILKEEVPQWIMKVFGQAVHRTIQLFYQSNAKVRIARIKLERDGQTQLFPKNEKGARGIWSLVWNEASRGKEANSSIFPHPCQIRFDGETSQEAEKQKQKFWNIGASMVCKYWRDNYDAPFPKTPIYDEKAVELSFRVPAPHRSDIFIVGVIDQIREINGKYWIVDLKTGWWDFGEEDARIQYSLHHDYQFTVYSYAFRQLYPGLKEAGIIRYPLGYKKTIVNSKTGELEKIDKKAIITTRTDRDYEDLAELIDFYVKHLETSYFPRLTFPRFYGYACKNCDYLEVCSNEEPYITKPITTSEFKWGQINKEAVLKSLCFKAQELTFSEPRLKLRRKR
jgi:hypothetical protein